MKRGWKSQICELIIARINPAILSWLAVVEDLWGDLTGIGEAILMRDPLFLDPCYDQDFLCSGLCKVVPASRMLQPRLDFAHAGIARKDVEPSACRRWLRSTGRAQESNLGKDLCCTGDPGARMHGCGHAVGLGRNFKTGNYKCSQTDTCQSGCRVSSSSQCHFMGC